MIILRSPFDHPAWNLAAEEYLLHGQDNCLLLYINRPSVILGRHQDRQSEVDEEWCAGHDVVVVRRMSGGGAVYHDHGNLNYCFVADRQEGRSALDGSFLLPVVSILGDMGLHVSIGSRKDLWIDGAKVSGTATHVSKNRILHHGTLLFDTDLEALHGALKATAATSSPTADRSGSSGSSVTSSGRKVASVPSPVTNLCQYLPERVSAKNFFNIFVQACCQYWQTDPAALDAPAMEAIGLLAGERYLSEAWNR